MAHITIEDNGEWSHNGIDSSPYMIQHFVVLLQGLAIKLESSLKERSHETDTPSNPIPDNPGILPDVATGETGQVQLDLLNPLV